jgi:hypothetical protein
MTQAEEACPHDRMETAVEAPPEVECRRRRRVGLRKLRG